MARLGIVILTSGIDLSPGSVVALCSIVSAYLNVHDNVPVGLCIVISIVIGVVIGHLHGWFITRLDVPPFFQWVALGLVLGVAIAADRVRARSRGQARLRGIQVFGAQASGSGPAK